MADLGDFDPSQHRPLTADDLQRRHRGTSDAPGSILTPRQRDYCYNQTDIEPQSQAERVIRSRIRKRTDFALDDMATLFDRLEARDLEATLGNIELTMLWRHAFAFLFRGYLANDDRIRAGYDGAQPTEDALEQMLAGSLADALYRRYDSESPVSVTVEIE